LQHRAEIDRMLLDQSETLSKGVWGKLSLTLQMTEMIYEWMQRITDPDVSGGGDVNHVKI